MAQDPAVIDQVVRRHLAAGGLFDDLFDAPHQDKNPGHIRSEQRLRALRSLIPSLEMVSSVLANHRQVSRHFETEAGQKWPDPPTSGKKDIVSYLPSRAFDQRLQGTTQFERSDPAWVFFTQEYIQGSRWYTEVGYTTRGGRRIVLQRGPWSSGLKCFKALQAQIQKKLLPPLEREAKTLKASLSKVLR